MTSPNLSRPPAAPVRVSLAVALFVTTLAACAITNHGTLLESARLKCHVSTAGALKDCYALDGLDAVHAAPLIKHAEEDIHYRPTLVDGRAVEVWAIISLKTYAPNDDGGGAPVIDAAAAGD